MTNSPSYDQIFKAIEGLTGKHIVSFVTESSKYCIKFFDGSINTIDIEFVDSYAITLK